MLNETQIKAISKLFQQGILSQNGFTEELNDFLNYIITNCSCFSSSDDEITKVFKLYISYGNIPSIIKHCSYSQNEISDILYYYQANDIKITLLAKAIYAYSGTKHNRFLKWQVNAILQNGSIDIKDEYIKWSRSLGASDEEIKISVTRHTFN